MKKTMIALGLAALLAVGCQPVKLTACEFTNDGDCDDGRLGADTAVCDPGTDEADCADVDPTVCQATNDDFCDDGRPGAVTAICPPGTDEADCGPLPE